MESYLCSTVLRKHRSRSGNPPDTAVSEILLTYSTTILYGDSSYPYNSTRLNIWRGGGGGGGVKVWTHSVSI